MEKSRRFHLKKGTLVLLLSTFVLSVAGFICALLGIFSILPEIEPGDYFAIFDILKYTLSIAGFLFVGVYVTAFYAEPHNNLMKLIYLVFAFELVNFVAIETINGNVWQGYLLIIPALMVAYMSGRLSRIRKNSKLAIVTALFLAAFAVISIITDVTVANKWYEVAWLFSPLIQWATIFAAYVARFELHKEAGYEKDGTL